MALENFIPEVSTARLRDNLHSTHVFANPAVINRDWQGEIRDVGDTVRINAIGAVTVSAYTKNSDMSAAETLDDAQTILTIDRAYYFNFQVDDVDRVQQRPKVMDAAMAEAAYALTENADDYIASLYTQISGAVASSGSPKTDLGTAGNAYLYLVECAEVLSEANVPKVGRFAVVPPWFISCLLVDARFVTPYTQQGERRLANGLSGPNGYAGRIAGFDVYESNNVSNDGTTWRIIAGHPMGWTFVDQIMRVEAYRPQLRFADAVKGLYLYGAKVTRPNALCVLYANEPS